MAQVEARAPRERSRSLLGSSSSRLRRSDDFSSQEESAADVDGRLVSVVRALSPEAIQVNRKIVLGENDTEGLLTVSLDAGDNRSASRAVSPSCHETSGVESRSRKRNETRRRRSSKDTLLLSLQSWKWTR